MSEEKHHNHHHNKKKKEKNSPSEPEEVPEISIDNGDLITVSESKCLNQLKEREVARGISDKMLMIFILARKLDVDRAEKLLTNNLAFCKEHNLDRILTVEDLNPALSMYDNPFSFWDSGCTDKQGRGIVYLFPGRFPKPGEMTLQDNINMAVYFFQRTCHQPLAWHRKGVCYIESLHGFSMSQVDTKGQKQVQEVYENNFPMRIQSILVVDPPARWFLRLCLKLAKKFMKAKIVARVQILAKAEVVEYVDPDQLLEEFGGNRKFDIESWRAALDIQDLA